MSHAEGEEKPSKGISEASQFIKQSLPRRAECQQREGLYTNSEAPQSTFIQRCQGELEWRAWEGGRSIRRMTEVRK